MTTQEFTVALVPLDERPVNTHLPQMLGAIGGAVVLLPPAEIRGLQRVPASKRRQAGPRPRLFPVSFSASAT